MSSDRTTLWALVILILTADNQIAAYELHSRVLRSFAISLLTVLVVNHSCGLAYLRVLHDGLVKSLLLISDRASLILWL